MAASCIFRLLTKPNLSVNKTNTILPLISTAKAQLLLSSQQPNLTSLRHGTGFSGTVTYAELWESATGVSNPGRKRGRAKGLRRRVDLNRGKRIGEGKSGLVFPGLTGPATSASQKLNIFTSKAVSDKVNSRPPPEIPKRKREKLEALQRGFSGTKMPGRSVGPPDPINDYVFEGFDSKCLEFKMVNHMTANLGRKIRFSALVATGNQKGLIGYAVAKSQQGKASLRQAKNKAGQRLQFIELYDGHTVFHNFYAVEKGVKLFVEKQPKGHGLKCQRVIKELCKMIGIQDIKVRCEGSTNPQCLVKAFIRGLLEQETHQKLADRKQLHVVEYRTEMDDIPMVVASPSGGRTTSEPFADENFDFENFYYEDGKVVLKKERDPLLQHTHIASAWRSYMMRNKERNQVQAKYERIIYGYEPSKEEMQRRMEPLGES